MRTEKTRTVLFSIAHTHSDHGMWLVVVRGSGAENPIYGK